MCDCPECCAERLHFATKEEADLWAGETWWTSRVSRHAVQCAGCERWVLVR